MNKSKIKVYLTKEEAILGVNAQEVSIDIRNDGGCICAPGSTYKTPTKIKALLKKLPDEEIQRQLYEVLSVQGKK